MAAVGNIVVIKRNGNDGISFALREESCLIGKHEDSDIRVQLDSVSMHHASLTIENSKVSNFSYIVDIKAFQIQNYCFYFLVNDF